MVAGAVSGFFGGVTDSILSRLADVFYAVPFILGAIVVLLLRAQCLNNLLQGAYFDEVAMATIAPA